MMTFEEVRLFLDQASKRGSILGLESIKALLEALSSLEGCDLTQAFPVIHIAGTNGKGSVGAFLSQILMEDGFLVGRYTSPAVFDPFEVWSINKEPISKEDYTLMMNQVKKAYDQVVQKGIYPTIFELETAMAFLYFFRKSIDVLLLEVGMGGATDATNVVDEPLCEVLTSISFDHMQFLGNSLKEIAEVKAGIIKKKTTCFSAPQKAEAGRVLAGKAKKEEARLVLVEEKDLKLVEEKVGLLTFAYQDKIYEIGLSGHYQMKNAALAIEVATYALEKLREGRNKKLGYAFSSDRKEVAELVKRGLGKASWPGRFQVIRREPLLIVDGAHNEEAALELKKTLENCFTNQSITYIIGVLADKEHEKMLKLMLPLAKEVYTVTPDNPRAMRALDLAEEAKAYHDRVIACQSLEEAVEYTRNADVTVAFGSLSYLGALTRIVR